MFAEPGLSTAIMMTACVLGLVVLTRRIPFLRGVVTLFGWALLAGGLLLLVQQRQQFDPYVRRAIQLLNLQDQTVAGDTVRIRMAPDGHFWAQVAVNGVRRRMLVDSGATLTALSTDTAAAAGLATGTSAFPVILNTANGMVRAQPARVDTLRIGTIHATELPVVISPAFGDTDVLGMNFLSRLRSWRVEGRTLILQPHHPQPVGEDSLR
ncbi:TIGR02281 family clan AA aspartic protease [Sphingomonadaceae bacterium jetA1]|uniref:retropepsin-like aspartic protease family protein n=1 Tax=Facivitalis istanbulensis TaxID=3075838 RepID=UPI00348427C8